MFSIEHFGVKTNPAKSAWNLIVKFDKHSTFLSHISVVCSSCFYHIQDLRRIHRYLDLDSAKLLATALVSSHLDYCNSLLYGITDTDLAHYNLFSIDCLKLCQSRLHLVTVFHCFAPFSGCLQNSQHSPRSIC